MLANLAINRLAYGAKHCQAAPLGVEGRIDKTLHDGQKAARALLGLLWHTVGLERQIDHFNDALIRLVVHRRDNAAPAGRFALHPAKSSLIGHQLVFGS